MENDNSEDKKRSRFDEEQDSLELGKFYFLNGKYSEAISIFNKVLKLNKSNYQAYYNLGLIYENQNLKDQSVKMFERAIAINPDYKLAIQHLNKLKGLK